MRGFHAPSLVLAELHASNPIFIEETALARVWMVRSPQGLAALKIYHKTDMGDEASGFVFIEALAGGPVVEVYKFTKNVALTEWLEGPSLGDMTRAGNDNQACIELVDVANRLHHCTRNLGLKLIPLEAWFSWLFDLKFSSECSTAAQADIVFCQQLAKKLLARQKDIRPLHGDLHHDNIRLGDRGYTAFDAKGLIGEKAFELANAFRNPKGAEALIVDPRRINMLLDLWSLKFQVERQRLLEWATVKIALSISWRCNRMFTNDRESPLLALFVGALQAR